MQSIDYKYLKKICYKTLSLWDVKRYVDECISFKNAVKLSDILLPHIEPLPKEELLTNNWQIISKINFAGKLYLRDVNEAKTFSGKLFKVIPKSLIYSKINVRHGCVYFHPEDARPFGVSSEYPVYLVDDKRALGQFLIMVIQSKYFKSILSKKTTGISKARVKPVEFLNMEIPLPDISVQRTLLAEYNDKIQKAYIIEQEANMIEKDNSAYLRQQLGATTIKDSNETQDDNKYLHFVHFRSIAEWGIELIRNKKKQELFKYPTLKIKDLCYLGSGDTPSRANQQYYNGDIPWVKTGEVVNDEIFETEEHITEEAIANSSVKLYPAGSLIIAMYGQGDTRGRTAKLGIDATTNQACAVLYNIDNTIVSTDYLWYYLQGRYHDLRSLASGNNQPNLNAGKIKNYDVVVPPMCVQNEIVAHIKEQKALAKSLRQRAQILRQEALTEFETKIFE